MGVDLAARSVTKSYGEQVVLDGLDLAIEAGEKYCLLGPNGAGKSTFLAIVATLLNADAGTVRVGPHDVRTDKHAVRRLVGVALQDVCLDEQMTGRELLRLQAGLNGMPKAPESAYVEDAAERLGLTDQLDKRIAQLSGGTKRKLDLLAALLHKPGLLIYDEPTTGLDLMSRIKLWEFVDSLNRDTGTTVLFSTQYLEEAEEHADRIGILREGSIAVEGTPQALKGVYPSTIVLTCRTLESLADLPAVLPAIVLDLTEESDGRTLLTIPRSAEALSGVLPILTNRAASIEDIAVADPTIEQVFVHTLDVSAPAPIPERVGSSSS